MVEGLVSQCETELGERATIIATGGNCKLVAQYMGRKFDYINPNLTLLGLKVLYKRNESQARLQPQVL